MKVSIIGGGTMGMIYVHNVAKMKDIQPAGMCDIDESRANEMARVCGTTAYTDIDELLHNEKPDVVCVCLPTYLHKEMVLKLAEKGVHIVCEKPIALNLEDAAEMQAASEKFGVRLFIGHVLRFFPSYRDAAEKVKAGSIGSLGIAHFKRVGSFPYGMGGWYHDDAKSGGVMMDLMIHDIDYARSLFGEVESVYANISRSTEPHMQYAQITLRFSGGRTAALEGMWGYPGEFTTTFELAGKSGVIRFDSRQTSSLNLKLHSSHTGKKEAVEVPKSSVLHNPYYYELEHFIACIRENKEPIVNVKDAYEAIRIALAAEQSAQTRLPVRLEELR